jgi:nicotinate-nucleotide adenylyltransferase
MVDNSLRIKIDSLSRSSMPEERYAHCLATAELARELCARFGADEEKGFIAGLFHDAAREMPPHELLRLAARDGLPLSSAEVENPLVLHGRAAAVLLAERAGYDKPDVLSAIRDHVTGRPSMGILSKILFVADFLEPTRSFIDTGFRKRTIALDLDLMVRIVLKEKIAYVRKIAEPVAEESLALREELEKDAR